MLLVKFEDNWADEMDIIGYRVFENEEDFLSALFEFMEYEDEVENVAGLALKARVDFLNKVGDRKEGDFLLPLYTFPRHSEEEHFLFHRLCDQERKVSGWEICIGSNEYLEYEGLDDFLACFDYISTNEQAIKEIFGDIGTVDGIFPLY